MTPDELRKAAEWALGMDFGLKSPFTVTYYLEQAADALEASEKRGFELAAGQCIYPDGDGLCGDERGNSYCAKDKRIEELEDVIAEEVFAMIDDDCDEAYEVLLRRLGLEPQVVTASDSSQ